MNEIQCKAAAAGFIHALRESPEVREQWVAVRKESDWERGSGTASLRELIEKTLCLAQTPSEKDLEAMRAHGQRYLKVELEELKRIDRRIEPAVVNNGADGGHGHGGHPGG